MLPLRFPQRQHDLQFSWVLASDEKNWNELARWDVVPIGWDDS
jgi:hypothetical protein